MSEGNEVRVALVMDDKASDTLAKVAEALAHLSAQHQKTNAEAHKTGGGGEEKGISSHGIAMGELLAKGYEFAFEKGVEAIHTGYEKLEEAFTAGVNELAGRRSLAGVLTMTDQTGASFDRMLDKGTLFKDTLEDMGVEAGVADDAMQSVFEGIAARSNKTALEVEELTEKVAYAGKAIPGGAAALAQGFSQMEMGMIRARNPVVQLIAASHVLKGNAKAVAKELQKMTPEKAMEVAEKAMTKMSEKMKTAPATFGGLMTSIKGVKEQVFEAMGVPMVEALLGPMEEIKGYLVAHKDSLLSYVGGASRSMVKWGKETFDWGKTIWDTINTANLRDTLTDGAGALVWAFNIGIDFTKRLAEGGAFIVHAFSESYQQWKTFFREAAEFGVMGDWGKKKVAQGDIDDMGKAAKTNVANAQNPEIAKIVRAELDSMGQKNQQAYGANVPKENEQAYAALQKQLEDAAKMGEAVQQVVASHDEAKFAEMYKRAADKHDEGTQFYMAKLLAGDEALQDALLKGGFGLDGSFAEIANRMKEAFGGSKESAEKFTLKVKGAGEKATHVTNFNGGQTFNVKQDFRDQDPDRVAVIFREDILKASYSRTQSNRASAFGAF